MERGSSVVAWEQGIGHRQSESMNEQGLRHRQNGRDEREGARRQAVGVINKGMQAGGVHHARAKLAIPCTRADGVTQYQALKQYFFLDRPIASIFLSQITSDRRFCKNKTIAGPRSMSSVASLGHSQASGWAKVDSSSVQ